MCPLIACVTVSALLRASGGRISCTFLVFQIAAYPKNADDAEVQHNLMAGVFPLFRQTLFKTCPIALRQDLAAFFPELLYPEMSDLMGCEPPPPLTWPLLLSCAMHLS